MADLDIAAIRQSNERNLDTYTAATHMLTLSNGTRLCAIMADAFIEAAAALRDAPTISDAPGVPTGWNLVPIEPTEEMLIEILRITREHGAPDTSGSAAYRAGLRAAPPPPAVVQQEGWRAIDEIAAERCRQVEAEGWSGAHDDEHSGGELSAAAAAYAFSAYLDVSQRFFAADPMGFWPWAPEWWKPKGARRDLIRAAALIVAEIERLDRLLPPVKTEPHDER